MRIPPKAVLWVAAVLFGLSVLGYGIFVFIHQLDLIH